MVINLSVNPLSSGDIFTSLSSKRATMDADGGLAEMLTDTGWPQARHFSTIRLTAW